jgi:chaperonin GroEL
MQAVLNDTLILLYDGRINAVKDLLPLLERVSQENKSLLIIAEDIDGEALSTLIVNKMRGILKVAAVKAPDFGDRRTLILEDIAIVAGGTVVSPQKGMKLERFNVDWFGNARTVTVGKDTTTIIDASGEDAAITGRVEELKSQIEEAKSPFEKENLQDRLAKFIGGVAIVYVGGHTEVEMKEKKDRVDDALHATRAALEEGILPGGGIALLNASKYLNENPVVTNHSSQDLGVQFVKLACRQPFVKILQNAGYSLEQIADVIKKIEEKNDQWVGYNPRTEEIVNMFEEGIIDPAKVTRLALENAASVAGTILLTEAVVSNIKKEKED